MNIRKMRARNRMLHPFKNSRLLGDFHPIPGNHIRLRERVRDGGHLFANRVDSVLKSGPGNRLAIDPLVGNRIGEKRPAHRMLFPVEFRLDRESRLVPCATTISSRTPISSSSISIR